MSRFRTLLGWVRLRRAAPYMLEACRAVLNIAGDGDLPDNGEFSGAAVTDMVRAAVARAEGKQSE